MIVETLLDLVCRLVCGLIDAVQVFSLPTDLVAVLAKLCAYGNAIVGSDLMIITAGCLAFWLGLRASVDLVVFLWGLLPLT